MKNIPIEVKHRDKALDMHENGLMITCTTVIPYVPNFFENIYLSNNLYPGFESKLFQKNKSYFFRKYIENNV